MARTGLRLGLDGDGLSPATLRVVDAAVGRLWPPDGSQRQRHVVANRVRASSSLATPDVSGAGVIGSRRRGVATARVLEACRPVAVRAESPLTRPRAGPRHWRAREGGTALDSVAGRVGSTVRTGQGGTPVDAVLGLGTKSLAVESTLRGDTAVLHPGRGDRPARLDRTRFGDGPVPDRGSRAGPVRGRVADAQLRPRDFGRNPGVVISARDEAVSTTSHRGLSRNVGRLRRRTLSTEAVTRVSRFGRVARRWLGQRLAEIELPARS